MSSMETWTPGEDVKLDDEQRTEQGQRRQHVSRCESEFAAGSSPKPTVTSDAVRYGTSSCQSLGDRGRCHCKDVDGQQQRG